MADLKICRICLRTEAKVYNYEQYQLKSYYEEVLALKVPESDDLPHFFCFECAMLLHKFHKFKEKCYFGQKVLKEILWKGPITYEAVYKIDRYGLNLESPLEIIILNSNEEQCITTISIKEEIKDQRHAKIENIEVDEDTLIENTFVEIEIDTDKKEILDIDNEKEDVVLITKNRESKRQKEKCEVKSCLADKDKWKIIDLTEEEAVKEFRDRASDEKYVAAAYRCTDCFKGFSKENMLKRHKTLAHNESNMFECRFCHMRFKWKCHVRKHMKQHYTKYECLRCHMVCPIENTAILHEQYHSGILWKCKFCTEEFRHSSTYYTHLRTHRSQFVCTLCGSSFVSEAGLNMHKRLKHCTSDESPDDDEDLNAFCSRCDIRFETRKAYEEHLFHSALHGEVVVDGIKIEKAVPIQRKILAKKVQNKITNLLKSRKFDDVPIKPGTGGRKRRQKSKPTTCHQCGKHFSTQAACMKHHLAEHPRTSFFAPAQRHICEICGASLAPGSVAVHQNMHSRERVHACGVCARQFHSSIGLKRHMVTHTGEKPFACSLCDKRFTQSNSMKLHYRTFHLKQPYPKRNRRKKKDDQKKSMSEDSCSEEPQEQKESKEAGIEPALAQAENSDINYLTLGYQKY
ncbi:unnamed protein product, partial [Brenthis ino]